MSERDGQRYPAVDDAPRELGEEQVVRRDGPDTASAWAVELLIAAAIGVIVYLLGTWTAAVLGGVVWLGTAVLVRMYAMRLQRRQGRDTRPSERA